MSGTLKVGGKTLATHDTAANEISFHSDVMATTAQVQGAHTTFNGSHSDTATTINLASVSGISAGDYVVGEGIATGTTVSSVGASSVVISAGLDTDGVGIAGGEPISFYKSTKALSPGLVAGGLCRAWVNFNGTGTVAIRAAHNVSSITDHGSGDYTITFATAMPDTNYSVVCSGSMEDSNTRRGSSVGPRGSASFDNAANSYSTASIRILTAIYGTSSLDPTLLDLDVVNVTILR